MAGDIVGNIAITIQKSEQQQSEEINMMRFGLFFLSLSLSPLNLLYRSILTHDLNLEIMVNS